MERRQTDHHDAFASTVIHQDKRIRTDGKQRIRRANDEPHQRQDMVHNSFHDSSSLPLEPTELIDHCSRKACTSRTALNDHT